MWYVCSDIHIGTAGSREDYFYKILIPQIKSGDTLVLLGDIFDYWISSFDLGLDQLSLGWRKLYSQLKELRTKGIDVIFVPGNHDSFIFYNEWSFTLPKSAGPAWLEALYSGGPFSMVRQRTTFQYPLSDVATICYPAFMHAFGGMDIVFTHGHWSEHIWPFITDDPSDPFITEGERENTFLGLGIWASVKAATVAFAYNHPDLMRRLFLGARKLAELVPYFFPELMDEKGGGLGVPVSRREIDPFVDIRRTEDIIFTVASDVWRGRNYGAIEMEDHKSQAVFAEMLHDRLLSQVQRTEKDPTELLGRERGRKLIAKWTRENNPDREWVHAMQRMISILRRGVFAYKIYIIPDEQHPPFVNRTFDGGPLGKFFGGDPFPFLKGGELPMLIHGHFHVPRRGATVIDDGCMLNFRPKFDITTYLRIDEEGHIYGP